MNTLNRYTAEYLSYCEYRKRLNFKTLKAYRIDLNQYSVFCNSSMDFLSRNTLDLYITELHKIRSLTIPKNNELCHEYTI